MDGGGTAAATDTVATSLQSLQRLSEGAARAPDAACGCAPPGDAAAGARCSCGGGVEAGGDGNAAALAPADWAAPPTARVAEDASDATAARVDPTEIEARARLQPHLPTPVPTAPAAPALQPAHADALAAAVAELAAARGAIAALEGDVAALTAGRTADGARIAELLDVAEALMAAAGGGGGDERTVGQERAATDTPAAHRELRLCVVCPSVRVIVRGVAGAGADAVSALPVPLSAIVGGLRDTVLPRFCSVRGGSGGGGGASDDDAALLSDLTAAVVTALRDEWGLEVR